MYKYVHVHIIIYIYTVDWASNKGRDLHQLRKVDVHANEPPEVIPNATPMAPDARPKRLFSTWHSACTKTPSWAFERERPTIDIS